MYRESGSVLLRNVAQSPEPLDVSLIRRATSCIESWRTIQLVVLVLIGITRYPMHVLPPALPTPVCLVFGHRVSRLA